MKAKIIKQKSRKALAIKGNTLIGVVQKGRGRGASLGAKTANLDVALAAHLQRGLYECRVEIGRQSHQGLLYYGINSLTKRDCLEVHILNYKGGSLYGKKIKARIKRYVRPPKRFKNDDALARQIKKDLAAADV